MLVKVEADTGEYGIGEIWNNFPSWGMYEKITTLKYGIVPMLIGEDPLDIAGVNTKLLRALTVLGLQWGALGPIYQSISGIDMALWDLKGKHEGKPVAALLGGDVRQPVQVYASGIGPDGIEPLIESHQAMGVTAYKLKVGKDADKDFRNLQRMRDMLRPGDKIMIDANQAWDRETAVSNLLRFQAFQLTWIEEPLCCDDFGGYRMIRERTGIPVAGGENLYGERHAMLALEHGALDVIQPDLSKNGGISEGRAMAEAARRANVPYAPHFLGGAVCLAASLHFFAGVPGGVWLELDANPNPFREKLFTAPFVVKDGTLAVPEGPGLGFELDPEFVDYYKIAVSAPE
ncbi:D-galactarolactone cycloisomerase [Paenibacillus solanacearum]|uniref:D-galactarolactone cycloisomerase n=1 Tax=Paenibacillus solanacearum TaxID=2048548 RepID=A0A916JRX7_9BACL|nr:D-galactarolactone cycloisomerase [Paenibacillus solanacearum]